MTMHSDEFDRLVNLFGRDVAYGLKQMDDFRILTSGMDRFLEEQQSSAFRDMNHFQSAAAALGLGSISAVDPTQDLLDTIGFNRFAGYGREEVDRQLKPYAWTDSLSALAEEWRRPNVLAASLVTEQLSSLRPFEGLAAQQAASVGFPLRDWLGASAVADAMSALGVTSLVEDQAKQLNAILGMVDFAGLQTRMTDLEQRLTRDLAQFSALTSLGMSQSAFDGLDLSWLRRHVEETVDAAFDSAEATELEPSMLYRLKLWLGRHLTKRLIMEILAMALDVGNLAIGITQLTSKDATKTETVAAPVPALCSENLMVVTRDSVRLRNGPTTANKVIIKLSRSHFVEKLGTSDQWVHVRYIDLQGNGASYTGWVHGKYLEYAQVATLRMLCEAAASSDQDKPPT